MEKIIIIIIILFPRKTENGEMRNWRKGSRRRGLGQYLKRKKGKIKRGGNAEKEREILKEQLADTVPSSPKQREKAAVYDAVEIISAAAEKLKLCKF